MSGNINLNSLVCVQMNPNQSPHNRSVSFNFQIFILEYTITKHLTAIHVIKKSIDLHNSGLWSVDAGNLV